MAPYTSVLQQNGENIFDVNAALGFEHLSLRKKISAAQAWPIAGDWQHLNNFHLFSKFPIEIRNKIWNFAAAAQEVQFVNIYVTDGKLQCNVVTPKLLHTCSESRNEAKFIYHELVFDGVTTNCYVNFDNDWVFFDTMIPLLKVFGENPAYPIFQQKCRKVALPRQPLEVCYKKISSRFPLLEEIAVTISDYSYDRGGGFPGNVVGFHPPPPLNQSDRDYRNFQDDLAARIVKIGKEVPNAVVTSVIVSRELEGQSKIMSTAEKSYARLKRKHERDDVASFRTDKGLAYQLQRDIDTRKVEVEVKEYPFDGLDEVDELGFGTEISEVFSDHYMNYDCI